MSGLRSLFCPSAHALIAPASHIVSYLARKKVIGEKAAIMMDMSKQISQDVKEANRGSSKSSKTYRKAKSEEQQFRKVREFDYPNTFDTRLDAILSHRTS